MVSIHGVDSLGSRRPTLRLKSIGTQSISRLQRGPHRDLVGLLVALEDGLRILPSPCSVDA
jgi:hypothetical protein